MININGKDYKYEKGQTILQVANENNIEIPTLCYLKGVIEEANCRICMVELSNGKLVPACQTLAGDFQVLTDSEKVINSRKNTLKLLLSTHHKNCEKCQKSGYCTLQKLFVKYDICDDECLSKRSYKIDNSSPCIVRDINKCILCNRCASVCSNTQEVWALTKQQRGYDTFMGCAFNCDLNQSTCVGCGQCALVCPTGAIVEQDETKQVQEVLNTNKVVVAQVAPSVRVSLAEAFGLPIGTFDEERMVSALKKLGFKYVFDVNLGADFTVVEESQELLERIKDNKNLPLFSSCCPAWFKYVQNFYPNHTKHLSSCKSPTEMLGAIIKNYYSTKLGVEGDDIIVVGIMPCTAKKGEKQRGKDVDYVLTTREVAKLIKQNNIDYVNLPKQKFDSPLSYYSGAGLIFGATGGVTEAVLREVMPKISGSNEIEFSQVRNSSGRKEVEIKSGQTKLHLCIVNGLANAKKVMDDIISNKVNYHFVEVMACPGGCVNGGGQIYVDYQKTDIQNVKNLRATSLYNQDNKLKIRRSGENEDLKQIYKDFFIPSPQKAKQLLHHKH